MAKKSDGEGDGKKENLPALSGGEMVATDTPENMGLELAKAESQSEIYYAVLMSKKFPRNEVKLQASILTACDNETFAEGAYYSFKRGSKKNEKTGEWENNIVSGPSIRMAREAARVWQNIRTGFVITHDDDESRGIVGYAWDVENNVRFTSADFFKKLIMRKTKADQPPEPKTADERELRELTNRRASILIRNNILSLFPAYFIDAAVETCKRTAAGGSKTDIKERIVLMQRAFGKIGISGEALSKYLGKPLQGCDREELANLRGIHEAIRDGVISPLERDSMFGPISEVGNGLEGAKTGAQALSEEDFRVMDTPDPGPPAEQKPFGGEGPGLAGEAIEKQKAQEQEEKENLHKPPSWQGLSDGQRKLLFAEARKAGKNEKDLKVYMKKNFGIESTKELTQDQFNDLLGFASFVPPTEPPAEKKSAAQKAAETKAANKKTKEATNGEGAKKEALDLIAKATQATFMQVKKKVLEECNKIADVKDLTEITRTLSAKQKALFS